MYLLSALVVFIVSSCCAQSHFEKVLLQNVDSVVLREGQLTNSRRVSPIPQLRCVGGSAGCSSTPRPNLVICSNIGSQRQAVRWECKADFDQRYKFGRIQVSCEGYEHSDDPYILKDSCGLEYEIDYEYSHTSYKYNQDQANSWLSFTNLFLIIAIGILMYALYRNSLQIDMTDRVTVSTAQTTTARVNRGNWSDNISEMIGRGIASFISNIFTSGFRQRSSNASGYVPSWTRGVMRGYLGRGWGHWGGPSIRSGNRKICFIF